MKKFWLAAPSVFLFLSLSSRPAQAGYGKGNHAASVSLGGVIGASELDEVRGIGPGGGVGYRYYLTDIFSLGADVSLDTFGGHYSDSDETDVDARLFSTSLVGRLDFWPRNEYATYVSLGAGSQYVERTYHEPLGDRTEKTGRAGYFLALGFEAPLLAKWMWGAELRSSDPIGVSSDTLGLKLTLSRRFGKDKTIDPAAALEF